MPGLGKVEKAICRQSRPSRAFLQGTERGGHLSDAREWLDPAHGGTFLLFQGCNSFLIICRHKAVFQALMPYSFQPLFLTSAYNQRLL